MLINTSRNPLTAITTTIAFVGAINWGLIGLFNFNLVTFVFGGYPNITRLIYTLVGICGLHALCALRSVLYNPAAKAID